MTLVLASASTRRQELLKNAGIEFVTCAANVDEIRRAGEGAKEFAERMAREKAETIRKSNVETLLATSGTPSELCLGESSAIVLGADTVVVVDDEVLGKPGDGEDAARMLRLLSGRKHHVITGVCLLGDGFQEVRSETTTVHFSALTEPEIMSYVESGESMDKAGAYAIQGMASQWISKIEGDYNNVVGLPVDLVLQMLREHGADG